MALFSALIVCFPPEALAGLPEVPYGMDRSFDFYSEEAEMGARWQRTRIFWEHVETSNDNWRWNIVDGMVNSLEEHGLEPVMLVRTGELAWATQLNLYGYDNGSFLPLDMSEQWNEQYGYSETYYDFIYHLVDHACGTVSVIVIENEGNSPKFFYGEWDDYLRLLKTAYKAAHDACGDIIVTDSGLASGLWGWCIAQDMVESGEYTDEEICHFATGYYRRSAVDGSYDFERSGGMERLLSRFEQYEREITFADSLFSNIEGAVDALNFHFYEDYEYMDDVVMWLDAKTQARGFHIPLKISNEMGIRNRNEEYDRESLEHAYDVIKKLLHSLRCRLKLFCWFPMSDGWNSGDEYRITTDKIGLGDGYPESDGGTFIPRHASLGYSFAANLLADSPKFIHEDRTVQNVLRWEFEAVVNGVSQNVITLWWDDGLGGEGSTEYVLDVSLNVPEVVVKQFPDVEIHFDPVEEGGKISLQIGMNPLFVIYPGGPTDVDDGDGVSQMPRVLSLLQNYPNPFNPQTVIPFEISGEVGTTRQVELSIYNARGMKVRTLLERSLGPGAYSVAWDGRSSRGDLLSSGFYFSSLCTHEGALTRKMLLLR
jgi:hypothetical protein